MAFGLRSVSRWLPSFLKPSCVFFLAPSYIIGVDTLKLLAECTVFLTSAMGRVKKKKPIENHENCPIYENNK